MTNYAGIFATPVTAFGNYGEIDTRGIRRLIDFIAENGIKNVFCLGSWGGFALLDKEERMEAIRAYLSATKANGMKCIVNVSATTAKEAIIYANCAEDNGAQAVASLVPYYYSSSGYTQENILKYFDELVSSVKLPVHFYNNPRTTGYKLDLQVFKQLLSTGIRGMKEGGGDPAAFIAMIDEVKDRKIDFDMIPGSVTMFLLGLLYGVNAAMIGSAVVFPELAISAWKAWKRGDIHQVKNIHSLLMKVRRIQASHGMGSAACYGLLRLRGINIGRPRPPWLDLTSNQLDNIQEQLKILGLPLG